ncbi:MULTISPECIES: carbohydrate porin [Citrobacter]|uniref:carbohydrate porin n=1 Tax=Citrobacter TaxID=544 RepID=UPI000741CCB9|nr:MULTISPECIES: carbohydrate porin [Citrobacter]EHG7583627.1 porin [Citrobacter sedlakii]EHG7614134.1 porin [Citrobacter sedlakii]EIQ7159909.1 carbohydrate porin [Citrobacter sedlakii]EKJ8220333.1 carbohydrate porin [Citrobacter sedlakii]EKX8506625.1 carbohydrate porin [Citrobacter sedlakii]
MKKSTLSLAIGLLLVANTGFAKTAQLTLEQRLEQLEARLAAAENRAAQAESQVQQLQVQQAAEIREIKAAQGNTPVNGQTPTEETQKNAATPNLQLSGYGDLKIYGDVEFNMDAESKHGLLAMTNANMDPDTTNEQWDLNGRILLGFDGMRKLDNGYFAGFSAQPLGDMSGTVDIDDAVFFFGKENDWKVKVGRFEAYDMFPLNQDTFVEHSGNTANDLYDDGSGYIYMMKEGRGRSDAGGNFLVSKQIDNWYFELNTLLEDGTALFNEGDYHGREMDQQKNVAYLRPVIAWSKDEFSVAAAMESNVVNNAYGYTDAQGDFVDQSDRTGYGLTMTWDGLKTDPDNGVVLNVNTAYLDASSEKDFTAGVNALWKRFELGYIYAHNKIDEYSGVVCDDDCWINDEGTYDIHTIHASYQFANVMDMENFNIYLGTYYSIMNSDGDDVHGDDSDDRYGARVRFKYYF